MSRMPRLAPVLIFAAIAATGCGGSSSTSTTKTFVAQADPICKQVAILRTAANTAVSKASPSSSKELVVLARVAPAVASDEQQALVRLRALKPPSSLTSDWNVLLTGMQQLASDTTQIASDAKAKKLKGVESVTSSGRKLRQQLTEIATRDGFTYCGRTS
jgi:hypothetical protein